MFSAVIDAPTAEEEKLQRLAGLDFSLVKRKLMLPEPEGKNWSQEQADEAEEWYRRFLHVIIKYPDACQHVPNGPIDAFWHQHILDTEAYARDCEYVLGSFLHHYPYFGLNGDAAERDEAFDITNRLYRQEFGEDCTQMRRHRREMSAQGFTCNSGGGTGCGQRGCGGGSR
ncbi:MAG: hypothetical protein G01um101438_687 [Parcubacteria group bacterium Gr01-1014_38]|nr:MAG: hypothetical protein G01um101438_687 [Parcubacteria group bacterium Gr01-1014_38]